MEGALTAFNTDLTASGSYCVLVIWRSSFGPVF